MTRLDHDSCVCAVCGDVRLHTLVSSSNQLGPPDFDTRPAEMLRGTLLFWVMECLSCGYAAPGIQAADARAIPIVRSVEYQHFRSNPGVREDARRFACYAFLLEKIEQFADAGWAWVSFWGELDPTIAFLEETGYFPASAQVAEDERITGNELYNAAIEALGTGRLATNFVGYSGWTTNVVLPEFQKILVGEATVEEAVDAMIAGLEDEIG